MSDIAHHIKYPEFPLKWFNPKPDITAYELALCTNFMLGLNAGRSGAVTRDDARLWWNTLTPEAQRHFEDG